MKPIAILNPDDEKFLSIQYAFTNVCNYECNYCWPESHAGTSRWPDYDLVTKNFDHLINVYKQHFGKEIVRFHILGGEPTLWPKLGDFAKFIKDKHDCRITMASNGSRTLRWWDEYAQYFNDIQISAHHEFCDVEHIKKVMDTIYNKGNIMVSANFFTGTLTTAAQPNITSTGTLTSLAVTGNVTAGNVLLNGGLQSNRTNVSVTTNTVIDQFAPADIRTAKYIISASSANGYQSVEALLVQDGTNSYITIYGSVCSNVTADIIDISSNINGVSGNVAVYATSSGGTATVNLLTTYLKT